MSDKIKTIREALEKLRRKHDECEDCWYSCPKSEDGCCDDEQGDECNCGADKHNAILDTALSALDQLAPKAEKVDIPEAIKAFEFIKEIGERSVDLTRERDMHQMVKWANHGIASLTP